MTAEGLLYADHFWGDKHHGFQVLQENLKKSEETVAEVAQFVKERLSVEDEYVKAINRSVNKVSHYIQNGSSIDAMWLLTKGTMELMAEIHVMLVKNLQDLSREVLKYKEDVNRTRKELKQPQVAEAVNLMQTTTTCLQKAKETYQHRCQELEKVKKETNVNVKEISKVELKVARAREEYKSYVDKYELVREDFETKMSDSCKKFQTFDRSLYASIQQFMLLFANHSTEMSSASHQVAEQFKESIQHLNADEFVRKFVKTKSTGTEKPPRVLFEESENGQLPASSSSMNLNPVRDLVDIMSGNSMPSSCSSSGILQDQAPPPHPTTVDLLMMDPIGEGIPVVDSSINSNYSTPPIINNSIPESIKKSSEDLSEKKGGKKLSMFIPKRRTKTVSTSSIDETPTTAEPFSASGLFKFTREKRRSKKENEANLRASVCMDDTHSTASSSKSDDKMLNGSAPAHSLLDAPIDEKPKNLPVVDDEGYIVRTTTTSENNADSSNPTAWSSCSSDEEEDEDELQKSRIRKMTISDRPVHINASVDELRDAIGSITLTRSTTFERDPWTIGGTKAPLMFSQSMNVSSLRQPLRSHHTADGRFRTNFSESEDPPAFSVSMGHNQAMAAGIARARPRSNTPTTSQMMSRKDSASSFMDPWSSTFNLAPSESNHSLGESTFNLSQSTGNLLQATISEQRIPLAMAINEHVHVWFKKGAEEFIQRTFGTVMISFPTSSITLLTSIQHEIEPLAFRLSNAKFIKSVLPNKQLIDENVSKKDDEMCIFYFNKTHLATWLQAQKLAKPDAAFVNAEVARFEMEPTAPCNMVPPLFLTSYWKFEPGHTDLRVDYRLNSESSISAPLLNVNFSTNLTGSVDSVMCEPEAKWVAGNPSLGWNLLEISRNGDVHGSLKARIFMKNSGDEVSLEMLDRKPAQVFVQFQCLEANLSGVDISLVQSDIYHLSMIRKKVLAGKYFCDPELRK
ncbi:FCH domain only protein 2 [Caenorhabditis elegans]|uniref:FCH domain only protein 2 n=1 Tax=Caenorhabditis elegans TaxID=6239 RepID=Q9TXS0_CAEEL|nr:FCH domain only protein 2 [Caenorhabditis elegans]CCD64350.1 FCH domain only protein 2 [Caenorhabditis elegans]|eukprot:NP_493947.1 FCH domain Only (FCH stands for Fes/CIP4 homology domain) [Caenorhabditis elegans]